MKSINFEHAAQRRTFIGMVYDKGQSIIKKNVLDTIDERFSKLYRIGQIHIHDMEAYGLTYNCLTPNILTKFPYEEFEKYSDIRKIIEILNHYKAIATGLGNEQSGGIAFGNFDQEIETLFKTLKIPQTEMNLVILRENIDAFMKWVNDARDRCGQVQYYISLNLGLGTGDLARFVTKSVLECFMASKYIRPNIIFKLKNGYNHQKSDKNYDLFQLALKCTATKMIPTYLLADSECNATTDPNKMSIMGCRTKVVQNENGEKTSLGRGNMVYTTISLPHISLEINRDYPHLNADEKLAIFKEKWCKVAEIVKDQLFDRYNKICKIEPADLPCNEKYALWLLDFTKVKSMEDVFKNGTLSIGFIGLSEAFELIFGEKYFASEKNHEIAINLVKFMREIVDGYRKQYHMNFTLLATSGEFISGRFPNVDIQTFQHPLIEKGFYTNSFHVDVDSGLNPFDKLKFEGPYHKYCNGGCISYIEFKSAPLSNTEAIHELVESAVKYNVNYLGFNFPMDRCLDCGATGTFDSCEKCGSKKIQRIRRVSGYLEELDFFTPGKKAEVAHRKPNV